jgi:hypothetical protein
MRILVLGSLLLAACSDDPCKGVSEACISARVVGDVSGLDQLAIRVDRPAPRVLTTPDPARPIHLPARFAIVLPAGTTGEVEVSIDGLVAGVAVAGDDQRITLASAGATSATFTLVALPDAGAPDEAGAPDLAGVDLAGADAGEDLATADLGAARVIFVMGPAVYGDFLTAAGGLAALDGRCTTAANSAGLPGNYYALIADGTTSTSRISFSAARPINLPSGKPVSSGLLFSGALMNAINEQADTSAVPGTNFCVWTGFTASGTTTGAHCNNWSVGLGTPNYTGTTGDFRYATSNWANAIDLVCNVATCFVYCIGD